MNRPAKSLRRKVGEQEKRGTIEVKGEEIPQEDRDEDFSGPVVKMWISLPWTWVQSLVGELRSHKPCSMEEKKEKEKNSTSGIINIGQWGNANGKWEHKDTECGVFFFFVFPRNFGVKRSERWQLEGSQGNWGEEVFCFKARWCLSSLEPLGTKSS